ncbi:MAG: hypothetical protein ACRD8O_17480, partial [Bryobacteraceae bacterium]
MSRSHLRGRELTLGSGVAGLAAFFNEMNRLGLRPLVPTLNTTGDSEAFADLSKTGDAFEKAIQPTLGAFVVATSKSMPLRGPQPLPDDVK